LARGRAINKKGSVMAKYETPNEPSPDVFYNIDCLHEALNDSGYICSRNFTAKVMTSIHTKPIRGAFLYGMAGTGKSYLPMVLAKVLDRQLFVHQCTQGTREEDLLVKTMPSENTISGVKIGHGKLFQAAIESRKRPVMLMLDEWDKTRPSADGFFLDFLQYGRLSLPGVENGEVNANLDNLTVFITANDEREFHEALLRRFPMIQVNPIEPADVVTALELTHDKNKLIPQMIDLYTRSIKAELPKPATIQELRQLMDAIEILGSSADWDTLVYQYITKTPENHILLSKQRKVSSIRIDSISKINASDYGMDNIPARDDSHKPKMPSLKNLAKFNESFEASLHIPEKASLVIERDDEGNADNYIMQSNMGVEDPELASMPEWGTITKKYDFLTTEINSSHIQFINGINMFEDVNGEILIKDKYITRAELNRMLCNKWHIHKRDKNEIIARHLGSNDTNPVDLRYREGKGMEIIAPTNHGNLLNLFKMNRLENLATIRMLSKAHNFTHEELDMNQSTYLAVSNLWESVERGVEENGNSVLKSFSEHNGYCQGIWIKSPTGDDGCSMSEIPYIEEIIRNSGKYKIKSMPNGFIIIAKNLHIVIEDIAGYKFGKMSLLIEGAVHPDILGWMLDWFCVIPLYKCFQHDGNIREKLENTGWEIHSNNVNVLKKNGIFAYIIYDYVIFCSFLRGYDSTDSITLSLNMKTKINRIRALEKAHKPNTD
jgi:hypothetical protein